MSRFFYSVLFFVGLYFIHQPSFYVLLTLTVFYILTFVVLLQKYSLRPLSVDVFLKSERNKELYTTYMADPNNAEAKAHLIKAMNAYYSKHTNPI